MNNELKNMNNSLKKFYDAYKEYSDNYQNNSDEINNCLEIFKTIRSGSNMYTSTSSPNIPKYYYDTTSGKNYILMYDKFLIKTNMTNNSVNNITLDQEYNNTQIITANIEGQNNKKVLYVSENINIDNLTNSIKNDLDKVYQVNLHDLNNKYSEITKYSSEQSLRSIDNLDNSFNFVDSECNMDHFNYCYSKASMNNNKYFGLKELRSGINNADCKCYYGDDAGNPKEEWVVHEVDVDSINTHTLNKAEYLSILMDGNLYSINEKNYEDVFNDYLTSIDGAITKITNVSVSDGCDPIVGSGVSNLRINLPTFNEYIENNCTS